MTTPHYWITLTAASCLFAAVNDRMHRRYDPQVSAGADITGVQTAASGGFPDTRMGDFSLLVEPDAALAPGRQNSEIRFRALPRRR